MKLGEDQRIRISELYAQGYGCNTISRIIGLSRSHISRLLGRYRTQGVSGLCRLHRQSYSASFKVALVRSILEKGLSLEQVAHEHGVSESAVYCWVVQVKTEGYASLWEIKPRGRPPKHMGRPKKREPQTELEKLRYENEYLRAEVALLKKVRALVEERLARESGKKHKPSKD